MGRRGAFVKRGTEVVFIRHGIALVAWVLLMTMPHSPRSGYTRLAADKTPVWKISPANGSYFINSVAVSADGGRVVGGTFYHVYGATKSRSSDAAGFLGAAGTSSDDGTFGTYCYDQAGNLLWKNEFSGWQGVYWVAIAADGSRAAAGGNMTQSPQAGFVRAFDGATGALLLDYATTQRVNQVALSADGTWLVSAAESLVFFRFDAVAGAYVQSAVFTPNLSAYHGGVMNAVVSLGISADGSTVVFADYAGHIGVLANAGGQLSLLQQYKLPASFCHMVALTPDGKSFAAGGSAGCFYLCETARFIADAKPTYTYSTGLTDPVYGVAVAAEGGVFAGVVNSGPDAGFVYVVEIVDFAASLQVKFATARNPNSASLNLQCGLLAVADGHPDGTPGHFYLFNGITDSGLPVVTPALSWQYQTGNMSWPITMSANGKAVVGGSDDSFIYYFTPQA